MALRKSFSSWVLNKVVDYLATKEGCQIEADEAELERPASIITDSFGFRYEITVRLLGRSYYEPTDPVLDYILEGRQLK